MKILIYGGGFDPPHIGHVNLLRAAIREIKPDLTLVIPSRVAPHKRASTTPFRHRRRMCRCFLGCGKRVRISSIEEYRPGKSYTVDTVRALEILHRGAEFYLLVGTDMLEYFEKWKDYRELLQKCTLVAGAREQDEDARLEAMSQRLAEQGGRTIILKNAVTDVSSTEIRAALAAGEGRQLLTPETLAYIEKHGLYGVNKKRDGER